MKKLITDKTLVTFEKWYYETHCKSSIKFEDLLLWQKAEVFDWLYSRCETIQYAFAVEFFDSVGIHINIEYYHKIWYLYLIPETNVGNYLIDDNEYNSRQEATAKAIEKANEIFNSKEFEQANSFFKITDKFKEEFKKIIKQ